MFYAALIAFIVLVMVYVVLRIWIEIQKRTISGRMRKEEKL